MPKSNYGKWSVGSLLVMFVLFFISSILTNQLIKPDLSGETIHANLVSRSILVMIVRGGFAAAISAFVNGLISIFDQKDRGLLVFSSTIIGAAFTLLFISNYLFPR